jgi:hypothetical protein
MRAFSLILVLLFGFVAQAQACPTCVAPAPAPVVLAPAPQVQFRAHIVKRTTMVPVETEEVQYTAEEVNQLAVCAPAARESLMASFRARREARKAKRHAKTASCAVPVSLSSFQVAQAQPRFALPATCAEPSCDGTNSHPVLPPLATPPAPPNR